LLYAAIADVLAAEFFPAKPISGFLLLALVGAIGFAVLFPFLGYLANNPSYVFKNPFLYLFQLGLPVLAVFATYVVAIIMRERSKRSPD
jgi:membrane protein DedA with SNARE-associated domain